MNTHIVNISGDLEVHREVLRSFLATLDSELKHLDPAFGLEKIMNSDLVLVALDQDGAIVGLNGTKSTFGIHKSYTVIQERYQRQGLGRRFKEIQGRKAGAAQLLMGVCEKDNHSGINFKFSAGYIPVGTRWGLRYFFKPLSIRGKILLGIIRVLFPALNAFDWITSALRVR